MKLRIATRKSQLALWQANYVKKKLMARHPDFNIELVPMVTQGDKWLDAPLASQGGKGLFVKELEQCLLEKRADIAVHSLKDMPVKGPEGLWTPVFCRREDPRDALVLRKGLNSLAELPAGARIGTSSLRRRCQLLALAPGLVIEELRGNVPTRLEKLDKGEVDGVVLAMAGLKRLGLEDRVTQVLSIDECLPAAGQGVMAIQCRVDDQEMVRWLAPLQDDTTEYCVHAEVTICASLGGNCHLPVAAHAWRDGDDLHLRGLVADPNSTRVIKHEMSGSVHEDDDLGHRLADHLLAHGGKEILASLL